MRPAERLIANPRVGGACVGGWQRRLPGLAGQGEFRRVVVSSSHSPPPSGLVGERSPSFGTWTGPIDAE